MAQSPDTIRVLHVDDESDLLELAATFLERMDDSLDVVHATSVTAGLERLSTGRFDSTASSSTAASATRWARTPLRRPV